jgi:hypothetical protein
MNAKGRAALVAKITVFVLGAGMAVAQQDEGPILRPKKPPAKPAEATLLVMCDLSCNWKLDGVAQGHIDASGSAKVKVELGQHVVDAVTEDGLDKLESEVESKTAEQTVVRIVLQPVRDARLRSEQDARDKADQEARDKAEQQARDKADKEARDKADQQAREQQENEQKERERATREEAAGVWTDPATGLMWTKKDSGGKLSWQHAIDYCHNLKLDGHGDWQLPSVDELQSIYDPSVHVPGHGGGLRFYLHAKAMLQMSANGLGWEWSKSIDASSGDPFGVGFSTVVQAKSGDPFGSSRSTAIAAHNERHTAMPALCVRRSGE